MREFGLFSSGHTECKQNNKIIKKLKTRVFQREAFFFLTETDKI